MDKADVVVAVLIVATWWVIIPFGIGLAIETITVEQLRMIVIAMFIGSFASGAFYTGWRNLISKKKK